MQITLPGRQFQAALVVGQWGGEAEKGQKSVSINDSALMSEQACGQRGSTQLGSSGR